MSMNEDRQMDERFVADPFDSRITVSAEVIRVELVEGIDFTRDGAAITIHMRLPRVSFQA